MGPPLPKVVGARERLIFRQRAVKGLVVYGCVRSVRERHVQEEDLHADHEDGLQQESEVEACGEPVEYPANDVRC